MPPRPPRRAIRTALGPLAALCMSLAAPAVQAQDTPAPEAPAQEVQTPASEIVIDWLPEAITLPADAEVVADRAVGSTIRMVSIATEEDAEALLAEWREALSTSGYLVEDPAEALADRQVLFSGTGIENGKVVISPTVEDGREILQFDASLSD
ncbi:hypothetical protein CBW24_15810 (plasmid) [Pacificitalea manganoxidans]|uniref:Uncharacterized protein n=1 Tax=Pacificitalea manganoxidans TaxID=1411902 RepID=A0A291M3Q0_9RHOB|nr:hypothetical protein [Pacificitalea manganoxidans]ATI43613.1 hypothetical protein CBW24_15810 [Pacificitalea manganoxidans]MDR6309948.1 hypothetical protein [Pacificitalea manganoxidans]